MMTATTSSLRTCTNEFAAPPSLENITMAQHTDERPAISFDDALDMKTSMTSCVIISLNDTLKDREVVRSHAFSLYDALQNMKTTKDPTSSLHDHLNGEQTVTRRILLLDDALKNVQTPKDQASSLRDHLNGEKTVTRRVLLLDEALKVPQMKEVRVFSLEEALKKTAAISSGSTAAAKLDWRTDAMSITLTRDDTEMDAYDHVDSSASLTAALELTSSTEPLYIKMKSGISV